jgi:hypothetical protein
MYLLSLTLHPDPCTLPPVFYILPQLTDFKNPIIAKRLAATKIFFSHIFDGIFYKINII